MITKTKTRAWGNSIGVIIPRVDAERMGIKIGETVIIEVKRKENVLRELKGSMNFGNSKKVLKDVRKDMESKWM